jgi:hypothetical protein
LTATLLCAAPATAGTDMVGDIDVSDGTVEVGDETYRIQPGSRIYDERRRLIRLIDLNRIVIETYAEDGLVLMGEVEARRAVDGRLDLIELRVETEEDE